MFSAAPGPGVAVNGDRGVLVHAGDVVAGVPVNVHVELGVQAAGDGVRAVGIAARGSRDTPVADRLLVQEQVELAQRIARQIELARRRHRASDSP